MKKVIISFIMVFLLIFCTSSAEVNRSVLIIVPVENTIASEITSDSADNGIDTVDNKPEETAVAFVYTQKKLSLTANINTLSDNAPEKTQLVWSSSDTKIAKVDNKGVVTGIAAGMATVTCRAKDDENIYASVVIEVRKAVKSLTLLDKSITVLLGASEELAQKSIKYAILPEDAYEKNVTWSSSDEKIATVSSDGIVQAVGLGKTNIIAKSNDPTMTKTVICAVTVGQAVSNINLSSQSITIEKGKMQKLTVSLLPADAHKKSVIWASSNKDIVSVDSMGNLSAKRTGTATITCSAADGSGINDSCSVTVIQKVKKITSTTKRMILFEDKSSRASLSIDPLDATEKTVRWSSSSSYIASVDSNGTVNAKHTGEAVITATAVDGSDKKYSFKVVVEPANPISLESIGFGIYMPNLLGLTVYNKCKTRSITDFNFDMQLYSYNGSTIDTGSYSLGNDTRIGAYSTKTIKRTVFGVGYATKVVITITGVYFSDGSYYSIPSALRETWTFRR